MFLGLPGNILLSGPTLDFSGSEFHKSGTTIEKALFLAPRSLVQNISHHVPSLKDKSNTREATKTGPFVQQFSHSNSSEA